MDVIDKYGIVLLLIVILLLKVEEFKPVANFIGSTGYVLLFDEEGAFDLYFLYLFWDHIYYKEEVSYVTRYI